jgi:DNA-binding LacI/PurR family transcriptional regulator
MPADLSAVTFSGGAPYLRYAISYARVPESAIGKAAVEMLVRHIAEPEVPIESKVIPFTLEAGGTLGTVPDVSN